MLISPGEGEDRGVDEAAKRSDHGMEQELVFRYRVSCILPLKLLEGNTVKKSLSQMG